MYYFIIDNCGNCFGVVIVFPDPSILIEISGEVATSFLLALNQSLTQTSSPESSARWPLSHLIELVTSLSIDNSQGDPMYLNAFIWIVMVIGFAPRQILYDFSCELAHIQKSDNGIALGTILTSNLREESWVRFCVQTFMYCVSTMGSVLQSRIY